MNGALCLTVSFTDTQAPTIAVEGSTVVEDRRTLTLPEGATVSDLIANATATDNRDGSMIITSDNVLLMNTEDGTAVGATDALISGATYRIVMKDSAGNEAFVSIEINFE